MKRIPWQRNVAELITGMKKGTIVFDNPLQRPSGQWKKEDESLLIDSIVRIFIPDVYAIKTQREINNKIVNVYDVIDGKQRSNIIYRYVEEDEFALSDDLAPVYLESTGIEHEIAGKRFSELDEEVQDAIRSYSITFRVIELEEDDDEEQVITEIFYRLNNGKSVSREHLALVAASPDVQAFVHKTLNNHPLYTVTAHFTPTDIKSSRHHMSVLQSLVLVGGYEWDVFGNRNIEKALSENKVENSVMETVTKAFDLIHEAFPEYNKFVTKVNLVSFVTLAVNNNFDNRIIDFLRSYKTKVHKHDPYRRYCGAGGTKKTSIEGRINGLQSLYNEFIGQ